MQLGPNADDGALLQRALEGQPMADAGMAPLVAVAREVETLGQRGLAPRADFVAGLRQRLLEETAGSDPSRSDPGPAVVRFGRRARLLVAAAAVLLVLAGGLGALSRSALPGDRLYPVKQLLDRVVLELHRGPNDPGITHLAQSRGHVEEAEQLIARARDEARGTDRDAAVPSDAGADLTALDADLTSALDAAAGSSTRGRTMLLEAYRSLQQNDALTSLADYYAEIVPAVDALHAEPLPSAATAAWQRLHDLLGQDRDATLRELAACSICGNASAQATALLAGETQTPRPSSPPDLRSAGTTSTSSGPAPVSSSSSSPRPTSGAGSAATSGSSGSGGGSSSPRGIVRLPTVGATSASLSAGQGGVTVPAPLPTVSLPAAGVSSSGVTVGGGGVTLPGATVSVPTLTVPVPAPLP